MDGINFLSMFITNFCMFYCCKQIPLSCLSSSLLPDWLLAQRCSVDIKSQKYYLSTASALLRPASNLVYQTPRSCSWKMQDISLCIFHAQRRIWVVANASLSENFIISLTTKVTHVYTASPY